MKYLKVRKVSFCGIKFHISESLQVTQVAVHTDGAQGVKAMASQG